MSEHILDQLYQVLQTRKGTDPEDSYVASLYNEGTEKICEKVMEEAAETIAEALGSDQERLKEESADLLFHLAILWADQNVSPEEVFSVLEGRFGTSGHAEKACREENK